MNRRDFLRKIGVLAITAPIGVTALGQATEEPSPAVEQLEKSIKTTDAAVAKHREPGEGLSQGYTGLGVAELRARLEDIEAEHGNIPVLISHKQAGPRWYNRIKDKWIRTAEMSTFWGSSWQWDGKRRLYVVLGPHDVDNEC